MKILALCHHPQMRHEAVKQGFSRFGLWFTSIWIAMALLAGSAAAASNDFAFYGYKPQAVIGKTTPLEVIGTHGPLQSVVITPADGLTVEGIRDKALEPGRWIRKGAKLWEFQLTVAPGSPAGERSVVLKTPNGDSKTETIVLVPYVPVIESFKILSAERSNAAKVNEQKASKTAIIRTSFSQVGSSASGTCEFFFSVANDAGYESPEQHTTVKFQ